MKPDTIPTPILTIERDGQPVKLTPACLAQALNIDQIQAYAMISTFADAVLVARAISVLRRAEHFLVGFEDDPDQPSVPQLLADLRAITDGRTCLNDSDGDGDCHLCHNRPGGCFAVNTGIIAGYSPSEKLSASAMQRGRVLHTKSGARNTGNAIVVEFSRTNELVHIETDFGNRAVLTLQEVSDHFTLGPVHELSDWRRDRLANVAADEVQKLSAIEAALAHAHEALRRREHGGVVDGKFRNRVEEILERPFSTEG